MLPALYTLPLYDFDLRATHARTLLPAALASVSFGFVLVSSRCWHTHFMGVKTMTGNGLALKLRSPGAQPTPSGYSCGHILFLRSFRIAISIIHDILRLAACYIYMPLS